MKKFFENLVVKFFEKKFLGESGEAFSFLLKASPEFFSKILTLLNIFSKKIERMFRRVRIFEKKFQSQNFLKICVGESGEAFSFLLKASPEIFFNIF